MAQRLVGTLSLIDLEGCDLWRRCDLETLPSDDRSPATVFIRQPDGSWFVDVDGRHCYETTPVELARRFIDEYLEIVPALGADVDAALTGEMRPAPAVRPPILLEGPSNPIHVVNERLGPLLRSRYDVLRALVNAYPDGLSEDTFKEESKREGCVTIAKTMRKRYPALRWTLSMPGVRGRGGYRVVWPGEWRA